MVYSDSGRPPLLRRLLLTASFLSLPLPFPYPSVDTPMSMAPYTGETSEQFLLVASDSLKFKAYNASTKLCRRTVLGPTFAGCIQQLRAVPLHEQHDGHTLMAFATKENVRCRRTGARAHASAGNRRLTFHLLPCYS